VNLLPTRSPVLLDTLTSRNPHAMGFPPPRAGEFASSATPIRRHVAGEVRFDDTRAPASTPPTASHYQISRPLGVVIPRDPGRPGRHRPGRGPTSGVPINRPPAAGTSLSGPSRSGRGVVIDCSKYLNRVGEGGRPSRPQGPASSPGVGARTN